MSRDSPRPRRDRALFVAYCAGHRCSALHRNPVGHGETDDGQPAPSTEPTLDHLKAAIRSRPGSVLISTACLGRCERASVAIVGWGRTAEKSIAWTQPPIFVDLIDRTERAAALASWIATTAPRRDTMPAPLGPVP